ncbi:Vms1/Ankzf1 family peptidyl-tRNA hydrolase [Microbacterium sp. Marseille-Q6965]|uniref:baeRF2 domain-containing protein n=1 Tax=Microbacterium sp. Marseille-Q6965 TaxID=2965072 RepID=UPI0021B7F0F4|nr:Vms1/Ankzf1 family peptidyl-tRNA hydrolase [Microbacterium sp. Marseille-Q6965]
MSEGVDLSAVLAQPGPWTYAYIEGRGDAPQVTERSRRRAVIDRLDECGAPPADVEAMREALDEDGGLPSPSVRYLLARDGRIEADERFLGPRLGPELIGHGAVPCVLPLVRHRATDLCYVVVETGREGAQVRVERAGRERIEASEDIQGRTDSLPKVQAGGWSHLRYQQHSEEIWSQTQGEVAEAVERLVREHAPRFVAIAGDVRARQLLRDHLGTATRARVVDVDAHTRAAGSDDAALGSAVAEALDEAVRADLAAVVDRASAGGGASGARGTAEVIAALQQARVDTLLLDARLLDATQTLDALDGPPWVADGDGDTVGAARLATVPLAEGLARAALLSGARVLVVEDDLPDGAPRRDSETPPPLAALRWSDGDASAD